jgi:hypothetical protein
MVDRQLVRRMSSCVVGHWIRRGGRRCLGLPRVGLRPQGSNDGLEAVALNSRSPRLWCELNTSVDIALLRGIGTGSSVFLLSGRLTRTPAR